MLHKRVMLGLTGLLMLAACGQPAPDEDVSDQGGRAPVVSTFSANQLGTGYYELGWNISDKDGEELRCTIQIDDGQVAGYNWLDLDEADDLVWVSSVAPEEADYNGFTFPVGGPNNVEGFSFPFGSLDGFSVPVGVYTGENTITPCTNLDKAYLAVRKPGSYYLRLMVTDSLAPVKTTYSKNLLLKVNNLKPYIAGFGALIDGEDDGFGGGTFFPDQPYKLKGKGSSGTNATTVTTSDFPLTVTFYWDVSDAFEEQWKDGGWSEDGYPSPFPGSSNYLKCSFDFDGNNIYEVTLPGDCRSYQGSPESLPLVEGTPREGYTHTFQKPGSYNVKLKVEDRLGGSTTATVRVGLENNEPPYTGVFMNTSFFQNYALPQNGLRQASTARLPGGYDPVLKGYPEEFVWFIVDKENTDTLKCFLDPEGDGTFQISLPTCTSTPPASLTGQVKGQDTLEAGCADISEQIEEYTGTFCLGYYKHAYPKRGQYFPRLKVVDSKGLATETQLSFNPYWGTESNGSDPPLAFIVYLLLSGLVGGTLDGDYIDDVFDVCTPNQPVLRNGLPTPSAGSPLAPFTRCDILPAMHFLPVANLGAYRYWDGSDTEAGFYRTLYQFGLPGSLTCTFDSNIFDSTQPVPVDCADHEWNPIVEYTTPGRYTSRFTVNDGAGTWSDTESICLAYARDVEAVDVEEVIYAAAWSPDSKWIAVGEDGGYVSIYDARNRSNLIETEDEDIATPVDLGWSPDSKYLAVTDDDDVLVLRVLSNGTITEVGSTDGDNDHAGNSDGSGADDVTAVAWSPNGKYIADASENGDIKIWSTTDLANIHNRLIETIDNTPSGTNEEVWSLAWSPNSRYLVSGAGNAEETGSPPDRIDADSTVKIWDLLDPTNPVLVATYDQPVWSGSAVAWSPDGRVLAAGDENTQIYFWDVSDIQRGNIRYKGQVDSDGGWTISSLAFSPDNRTLVSGVNSDDGGWADLWDVANLNEVRWMDYVIDYGNSDSLSDIVSAVGFSPDGKTFFTGDDNEMLVLWSASDLTVCTGK